jgi:hypothetical protein
MVSVPRDDEPRDTSDPWAAPDPRSGRRPPRSTGYKVFLGLTVTICVLMGLFMVAGAVFFVALSNSRGFGNK